MTVSAEALEAAARWYVALQDVDADEATRAGWGRWLDADARHRQAWARMLDLQERLGSVPGDVLLPTLQAARQQQRRRLLALALLAGGGAGLGLYSTPPWRVLTAGLRTATGERRTVTLPDGGMLYLNTGSAVDVDYGSERRLLRLYQGEVLVQTAPDNAGRRPFEVLTSDGSVRALGTRFSVRRDEDATRVAVFQDAVLLQPADPGAAPLRLSAGQQSLLTARAAAAPQPVLPSQAAWVDGRLVAIDQPLGDFIAELARYRSGSLTCDPAVSHLRLSGAFRLADTDAVLENVAASLPVALRTRTRYWVRVMPR
ncbi:FecR domain-containing protein [Achromobacter marplatensis]|uniref:FecR domain-containing protein n=1 Tax=Achromobacter marplatensis TaxID=470868 RepID=A0AA43B240_9BURK|nr:FecR domain-containing protein [Achromobacter marplatensis]MDH2051317.1 FecR domain-containing protein [Achromobacter marplatensis]